VGYSNEANRHSYERRRRDEKHTAYRPDSIFKPSHRFVNRAPGRSHRTAVSRPHPDCSKTPGLETSRSSMTVRVLHGNVERLGDAQPRKESEVKRNAGCDLSLLSFVHGLLLCCKTAFAYYGSSAGRRKTQSYTPML
jgi:hypothetical protein